MSPTLEWGFSVCALDILGYLDTFVVGGCPVHCQMFTSIPSLRPLAAGSIPAPHIPVVTIIKVSRHFQMSSQLTITALKESTCRNSTLITNKVLWHRLPTVPKVWYVK